MIIQGTQGLSTKQTGSNLTAGLGEFSELLVTELQGRYYEQTYRGNKFFLNASGVTPTAFTGGAAGTPLIGVMNPAGSGKNLVLVSANVGNRAAASAAGVVTFNIWAGVSVSPTGSQTVPTNMLTQVATGSIMKGFVNTALTSSTAIAQILPIGSYYWATAASAFLAPINYDFSGEIVIAPGVLVALGATAALTSATWDATLIWDEIPV